MITEKTKEARARKRFIMKMHDIGAGKRTVVKPCKFHCSFVSPCDQCEAYVLMIEEKNDAATQERDD